jgi:hypothetical protein
METVEAPFRVPDQLGYLIDDHVLAVHEQWSQKSYRDVLGGIPPIKTIGSGTEARGHWDLPHNRPAEDTERTVVLYTPHLQGAKPAMFIRSAVARDVVAPNSRMVVFPNNSVANEFYTPTDDEIHRLAYGNLKVSAERDVRALERLGVKGKVAVSGYALGGLQAAALASVGSDQFEVDVLNADEAPNKFRTAEDLRGTFLVSGTWREQRAAVADAALPALSAALNVPRLAIDYANYGFQSLSRHSRIMLQAMANSRPNLVELINDAQRRNSEIAVKLGYVSGSAITYSAQWHEYTNWAKYSGEAAHAHPTGDNVMAHALMIAHAFSFARGEAAHAYWD